MKILYIIFLISAFLQSSLHASESRTFAEDKSSIETLSTQYTKEEKLLYLNITTGALILAYGVEFWEYSIFHTKPHAQSEGWFEKNTKHGGADKLGHAYVGYLSSHIFSYAYEDWGYSHNKAALYGAYSSFLFTSIMEVGDSFSGFGLSYEDVISNALGAILGYYTYKNHELKELLDFRVEYKFSKDTFKRNPIENDFTTDYENMKYLFAIKASGLNSLKNSNLKYLELYLGYNIKGYDEAPYVNERYAFVGVGINLSKLLNMKFFNYYQVQDIYISKQHLFE